MSKLLHNEMYVRHTRPDSATQRDARKLLRVLEQADPQIAYDVCKHYIGAVIEKDNIEEFGRYSGGSVKAVQSLFKSRDLMDAYTLSTPREDHPRVHFDSLSRQYTLVSQPYHLNLTDLKDIVRFCEHHEVSVQIDGASAHNPGHTVRIVYQKPGLSAPRAEARKAAA